MVIMDTKRNNRVEETLNSLDGCKRATAPDFFYTRLRARMERELTSKSKSRNWVLRPVYIVSALFLVLALNVFVLLSGQDETTTTTADNNESFQQSMASEYNLNDINTVYDLNQDK
jgi:hypothetical protein